MDEVFLTIKGRPYRAPAWASFPVVNPGKGKRPYIAATSVNVAARPVIEGDAEAIISMNMVAPPPEIWAENGGCYRPDHTAPPTVQDTQIEEGAAVSWEENEERVDEMQPRRPTVVALMLGAAVLTCGILAGLLLANR